MENLMLKRAGAILFASGLILSACSPQAPPPTVNASMTQVMAPHAQTVWDITSRAFNARGDALDASKISDSDWAQMEKAGEQIKERAVILAKARRIVATAPGETIMGETAASPADKKSGDWDAASGKQVQAMIDANPALFVQRAQILANAGETIRKASRTKDARKLYEVSSNLDEVCDGCHQKYWGTDEPPPFPK